jgi:hypothetical protein
MGLLLRIHFTKFGSTADLHRRSADKRLGWESESGGLKNDACGLPKVAKSTLTNRIFKGTASIEAVPPAKTIFLMGLLFFNAPLKTIQT